MSRRIFLHARWILGTVAGIWRWPRMLHPWVAPGVDRLMLRLLAVGLILRLARLPVPLVSLAVTIAGRRRRMRVAAHHELAGAIEVLSTPDYDVPLAPGSVHRILDLGANVGFATLLFACRFPNAEVVALEPAPDTFARLRHNVGDLSNVTLMPFAAGAPGSIVLDMAAPSTERRGDAVPSAGVAVRRLGLTELLSQLGWDEVDVLKIDIEGDEFALLSEPAMSRVRVVVGELHGPAAPDDFAGVGALLPEFDVTQPPLDRAGVVMFRAVRQSAAVSV